MRKMTLPEIQSIGLDIMKEIHAFCMENGIEYTLAYGSLIGAVRHKGFIPWDDDIDLWMTRPNFEKFSSSFKSNKGYQLMSVYDKDNYCNYTRVYEVNKTLVKSPCKACVQEVGVWVDVFPIDGVSDDQEAFKKDFEEISVLGTKILHARYELMIIEEGSLYKKTKSAVKWLIRRILYGGLPGMHKRIINLCKQHQFGDTCRCGSLVCVDAIKRNKPETFPVIDFSEYILMPFETELFMVSTRYDHILTIIFGDYMQIPPKEKQVAHALTSWQFYWK